MRLVPMRADCAECALIAAWRDAHPELGVAHPCQVLVGPTSAKRHPHVRHLFPPAEPAQLEEVAS